MNLHTSSFQRRCWKRTILYNLLYSHFRIKHSEIGSGQIRNKSDKASSFVRVTFQFSSTKPPISSGILRQRFGRRRTFVETQSNLCRTTLEAGTGQTRTNLEPSPVHNGLLRSFVDFYGLLRTFYLRYE